MTMAPEAMGWADGNGVLADVVSLAQRPKVYGVKNGGYLKSQQFGGFSPTFQSAHLGS